MPSLYSYNLGLQPCRQPFINFLFVTINITCNTKMNAKLNQLSIFVPTYLAAKATEEILKYYGTGFIQFWVLTPNTYVKILLINFNFLMYVRPCIMYDLTIGTNLMQQLWYIIKNYLCMFRASTCPSSGVEVVCYCIWCSAL